MTKARLQWLMTGWLLNILAIVLFNKGLTEYSIIAYFIAIGCFLKSAKEAMK